MPTSRSHRRVYYEAPRHNELPAGTPGNVHAEASGERAANGKLAAGARTVPSLGGKAQRGRTALSHRVPEDLLDEAGRKRTRALRKALCREYAQSVGGGRCGVGASLMLKMASVLAELGEQALKRGDEDTYRKNAESIRTTLAYAREDCAKVATAQREAMPADPNALFNAALEAAAKERTGG